MLVFNKTYSVEFLSEEFLEVAATVAACNGNVIETDEESTRVGFYREEFLDFCTQVQNIRENSDLAEAIALALSVYID